MDGDNVFMILHYHHIFCCSQLSTLTKHQYCYQIIRSVLSDGVHVLSGYVIRSVLSDGVHVLSGYVIRSVLSDGVHVLSGYVIRSVFSDGVHVLSGYVSYQYSVLASMF